MLDAVPVLSYEAQMEKFGFVPFDHKEPNFFPVREAEVYDGEGRAVPGYKRIERGDTGDTLHIATSAYSLVPYETHFGQFERAIKASRLPWRTMRIGTDLEKNGSRVFRQYLFPDTTMEIDSGRGVRHIALRIFMFDSYDGSSALTGRSGFFNFLCCNQAIMGTTIADVKFRHVGDMEAKVQIAADTLTSAAEEFVENMKRLARWPQIAVNAPLFGQLIEHGLPQANPKLVDYMTAQFARTESANLWDAHDLLTTWSTHGIPTRTAADRQKRVATLIEGKDWCTVEAA